MKTLTCENCGEEYEFEDNSPEVQGLYNVFCDEKCAEEYQIKSEL